MVSRFRSRRRHRIRTGFTLMESMMASSLMFITVVAVLTAITAGQQHAYEAHIRIAGTLAAEDLMGRVARQPYDDLPDWHQYRQEIGNMTDENGDPLPEAFDMLGRVVTVITRVETMPNGVKIRGRHIHVRAIAKGGRLDLTVQQFVPEPPS